MSLLSKIILLPLQSASDCIPYPPTERDWFRNGHFSDHSLSLKEAKLPLITAVFKSRLKQQERGVPAGRGWGENGECSLRGGGGILHPSAYWFYLLLSYLYLINVTDLGNEPCWIMMLAPQRWGQTWRGATRRHSQNIAFIPHRAVLTAGLIPSPPLANLPLCKAESSPNRTISARMEFFFSFGKQREQNRVLITMLGMCFDLPGEFDMRWTFITGHVCWEEIVFGKALDLDVIVCS